MSTIALGETALHVACRYGHAEIVGLLAEAGGRELLLERTDKGLSCLDSAVDMSRSTEERKQDADEGKSTQDVRVGSACEVIKTLLRVGGEEVLRQGRANGQTCLHVACAAADVALVQAILRAGGAALLLAVEPDVGTCLHLACKNGSLPIVRELLQAAGDGGALLQPVGKGRWTPLYVASIFGHAEVVRLLLEAPGGREVVNAPAECGSTPLDAACVLGHARTARLLAAAGGIRAKPDARAP